MELKMYKMSFNNAHFGEGYLNTSSKCFTASRLFSALFLEAIKLGKQDEFLKLAQQEDFVLSDAFPFCEGKIFFPKPEGYPVERYKNFMTTTKDIRIAKKINELQYIPIDELAYFIETKGSIEKLVEKEELVDKWLASYHDFARKEIVVRKGVDPYEVEVVKFKEDLCVIASHNRLLSHLISSLQFSGIGGKRTSGLGAFTLEIIDIPQEYKRRFTINTTKMTLLLSSSLPATNELRNVLGKGKYRMIEESGFAYSEQSHTPLRKKKLWKFAAGSVFYQTYIGQIIDVRPQGMSHPVWNFSKGLFYEI